jgi:hypothetical protein
MLRTSREPGSGDDEMPTLSTDNTMVVAIYICSAAFLTIVPMGVYNLESWVERWDYERHHED